MRFTVVGTGRAGLSFAAALQAAGWPAPRLIDRAGAEAGELAGAAQEGDVVLLTVPDDRIAEVAAAIEPGRAAVVHCSGATGLGALAPHPRRASVHPLVSLPDPATGAAKLRRGGVFAVAGDPVAAAIVAALGGTAITVDDAHRPLYHATAAVAANHLVALCAQVERLAGRVGVPAEAYWELMATTLENVRRSGPLASLTGPAARGDTSTIALHLEALPNDEQPLYLALAREAARLAGRRLDGLPDHPGSGPAGAAPAAPRRPGPMSGASTPKVVTTIAELRALLDAERREGRSVGFVPTMGYLHDGHASLMRAAAAHNDVVAASIFVNPLQFAPTEDLASYPRDLDRDLQIAAASGVHLVFHPDVTEMYPEPVKTSVSVSGVSELWEGASRPTHFAGVATVVSKLFNIAGPCRAYFGEKDYQQLTVIRRMVADLSIPVEVIGCPIIREPDGLAMSSRNVYLDPDQRAAAVVLRRALDAGTAAIEAGERDPEQVAGVMRRVVEAEPLAHLDYACAVDPDTLEVPGRLEHRARLLIAARVGTPRLIDNCGVELDSPGR